MTQEKDDRQIDNNKVEIEEEEENLITSAVTNRDLSPLDHKMIKYLDLLDEYIKTSDNYKKNFQNGFINLSRANYASNKRFNKDFYDHRDVDPVINVLHNDDNDYMLINNLNIQKQEQKRQKESSDNDEKQHDLEIDEKDQQTRNRKTKQTKQQVGTKDVTGPRYKNPINMFGAFVPYQLRESQSCFFDALENSINLINIKMELQQIYAEIKSEKKQRIK